MVEYASLKDTVEFLQSLGFTLAVPGSQFYDSPGSDYFGPVVQAYVYENLNGWFSVDLDGGWMAPAIWNGPKASWDKSDTRVEFVEFLDANHPGWR